MHGIKLAMGIEARHCATRGADQSCSLIRSMSWGEDTFGAYELREPGVP